jgi:hypothetical protein
MSSKGVLSAWATGVALPLIVPVLIYQDLVVLYSRWQKKGRLLREDFGKPIMLVAGWCVSPIIAVASLLVGTPFALIFAGILWCLKRCFPDDSLFQEGQETPQDTFTGAPGTQTPSPPPETQQHQQHSKEEEDEWTCAYCLRPHQKGTKCDDCGARRTKESTKESTQSPKSSLRKSPSSPKKTVTHEQIETIPKDPVPQPEHSHSSHTSNPPEATDDSFTATPAKSTSDGPSEDAQLVSPYSAPVDDEQDDSSQNGGHSPEAKPGLASSSSSASSTPSKKKGKKKKTNP